MAGARGRCGGWGRRSIDAGESAGRSGSRARRSPDRRTARARGRRWVEAQHHLPGPRGRHVSRSGRRIQDRRRQRQQRPADPAAGPDVRDQRRPERPQEGGHGDLHPVALRVQPALRDPGRRPDHRAG